LPGEQAARVAALGRRQGKQPRRVTGQGCAAVDGEEPCLTLQTQLRQGRCDEVDIEAENGLDVTACGQGQNTDRCERGQEGPWRGGGPYEVCQSGRAHVCTPVTFRPRMPSSP